MRLDIRYRCSFEYGALVHESQNELRACPTTDGHQTLLNYRVTTSPASRVFSFENYWGTRVDTFGVREPHIFLEVVAEATVETKSTPLLTTSPRFDSLKDPAFVEEHWEYLERTPHADWNDKVTAEAQAQADLTGPEVVSAALGIHRRVGALLSYKPGTTYVGVDIDHVLERGEGVCQDYAHLAVAMCRSVGIPARYVSGYLFTDRDDTGEDVDGDEVSVQTHAWFEAAIPGVGWLALDPTNRQAVGLRHVKIGHGRDYDDVSPLRGTYSGPRNATLDVSVEMRRLAGASPAFNLQHQQEQQQQ
ncbi:MAG: transglutaminase-like enzyme predicted cysteine protease [Actinomycetia bacterium]|nr:transglutaminase-like enzyme predicted cysteine protease [Actinomycetes bacterium]